MHTYERPSFHPDGPLRTELEPPPLRSIGDLIRWAGTEPAFGAKEEIVVWHLDDAGDVTCWQGACSHTSLLEWSSDPSPLLRARLGGLDRGGCGSDWLITDSRTPYSVSPVPPDAADAEAATMLHDELADIGVRLLDVVVFDCAGHWWSGRELAGGVAGWSAPAGWP